MSKKYNPYVKSDSKVTPIDRRTGEVFNPLDFGPAGRNGKRKTSSTSKVFNEKGELNASSNKEALDKTAALINALQDGEYQIDYKTAGVDSEGILKQALSTEEGKKIVAQQMDNVIKEIIDYEGVARKIFKPRTVKAGEYVQYQKDPFVQAWVIAEDGQTPESVYEARFVHPPSFGVTSFPVIEIRDKFHSQFDIVARLQDRARQDIEHQEDVAAMNLLNAAGNAVNPTTFFASLNLAAFEGMKYQIERHRLLCDKFIIHRQEQSDMINVLSAQVDPVTQRELIMQGYLGSVLNCMILTTAGTNSYEILDPGEVIAVTSPEYLGGMPIHIELFSEPAPQYNQGLPRDGFFFYEEISQVVITPAGVALGSKT